MKVIDSSVVNKEREHVSFSEIYLFYKCPFKHHTNYNLGERDASNFYAMFGTSLHEAIEEKWKNGNELAWIKMGKRIHLAARLFSEDEGATYMGMSPSQWVSAGLRIYKDFFPWFEENFPDCELYDMELELKRPLEGFDRHFLGFIDLIVYNKKEDIYHVIDLKTTKWGWGKWQLSDTQKLYQVILYKHFFCEMKNIDPKKVQCHYVLLLREPPKKIKHAIKIHSVTSGPKKISNSIEWMNNTLASIKRGIILKKPQTCSFCICGAAVNKFTKKKA